MMYSFRVGLLKAVSSEGSWRRTRDFPGHIAKYMGRIVQVPSGNSQVLLDRFNMHYIHLPIDLLKV